MFANSLKRTNWNIITLVFRPFTQYSVEAPLAVITSLSLHDKLCTPGFADLLKLCQVEWRPSVDSLFRSLQRCLIGFKSGLWLGHSRTFTESLSHSCIVLAMCLGSLSLASWRSAFNPVWGPEHSGPGFCIKEISVLPSTLTSCPVPAAEKHPQRMMLSPQRFTVRMVLSRWWVVPGFLQTRHLTWIDGQTVQS